MNSLTWNDIFVDAALLDFYGLLLEWPGLVTGQIRPIGASVFGDLFYERRSGEVEKLDVLDGGVHVIADSIQKFSEFMNSREWQEHHLLSEGVALLVEKGFSRAPGEFYGFAPHPAFAGKIDWSKAMPLDAAVWNSICAQTVGVVSSSEPSAAPSTSSDAS